VVDVSHGCAGGTPEGLIGGYGGGALQITSRTQIKLSQNSSIRADGYAGYAPMLPIDYSPYTEAIPGGGGGGGSLLLEALVVTLDNAASLTANGGGGTSGDLKMAVSSSTTGQSLGGICASIADPEYACGNGGNGGSIAGQATNGGSHLDDLRTIVTGGGGGSVGTIRINTATGSFTQASAVMSPTPSTGIIKTR